MNPRHRAHGPVDQRPTNYLPRHRAALAIDWLHIYAVKS